VTDSSKFLTFCRTLVDAELERSVPAADVEPIRLHEAIRWSLFAGGKRFRPAVVIATGRAFGALDDDLIRSAAAVELIHTFSLIHDDLPAMDDDDLRRGRLTCHKKYGEATAILAGDVLQTLAFKLLAEDAQLDAETRVRVISKFADASGTPLGMVAGQQLDLEAEGRSTTIDELETIHSHKTGALITASAEVGAIIGGADQDELTAVIKYAQQLGLLFQITDDILDVTQSTDVLGKTAGKDAAAFKATYPGTFGIERTRTLAANAAESAKRAIAVLDRDTALLESLVLHILSRTY